MGVDSGIVMSYEFGTNWSVLSERAGNVGCAAMSELTSTACVIGWKSLSGSKPTFPSSAGLIARDDTEPSSMV